MSEEEKSESGSPVFRHEAKEEGFVPAHGDEANIQAISDHIEKHIGPIESVFHEILSHLVHIDVHWVKATKERPYHAFITSGMSDIPMHVPEGLEDQAFAEVLILLPADWGIEGGVGKTMDEVFEDELNYWPIGWLKSIARFPHEYETYMGWGHSVPNGEHAEAFAPNTEMGCMLLLPAIDLPVDFFELKIHEGKTIRFYGLYPIYKEEMEFKLKKGTDALVRKFDKYEVSGILNPTRVNTCKKKGFLGLW